MPGAMRPFPHASWRWPGSPRPVAGDRRLTGVAFLRIVQRDRCRRHQHIGAIRRRKMAGLVEQHGWGLLRRPSRARQEKADNDKARDDCGWLLDHTVLSRNLRAMVDKVVLSRFLLLRRTSVQICGMSRLIEQGRSSPSTNVSYNFLCSTLPPGGDAPAVCSGGWHCRRQITLHR